MSNPQFRSDQVVEEVVQFNQNLSKGIKNLLDADEISSGVTPREEVYAEDKLKLYRYQPSAGVVQNRIPTLIVYALVNRPYMADIQENRSTIRGLLDTGMGINDNRGGLNGSHSGQCRSAKIGHTCSIYQVQVHAFIVKTGHGRIE